jgi:acetyl-CoA carboxylase biotin carboxyl carrier protein
MTQTKKRSSIDLEIIRQLASVLAEAGLSEIEYATGDCRIRVSKILGAAATAQVGATTPNAAAIVSTSLAEKDGAPRTEADEFADHPGLLTSPMVGVVYTSSESTAPPFVQIGDQVAAGDTVLLIEAMKVFNPIKAHRTGTIERVFVTSGMPVEYGEPLVLIA